MQVDAEDARHQHAVPHLELSQLHVADELVEDDLRDVELTLAALEEYHLANMVYVVHDGAAADVGVAGSAKSRYQLFVEFQEGAAPADLSAFTAAFDQGLCSQNRVYREHRDGDVALLAPCVVPLTSGGARLFLEEVTRGNVQGKFPRIIDDTKKKLLWEQAGTR